MGRGSACDGHKRGGADCPIELSALQRRPLKCSTRTRDLGVAADVNTRHVADAKNAMALQGDVGDLMDGSGAMKMGQMNWGIRWCPDSLPKRSWRVGPCKMNPHTFLLVLPLRLCLVPLLPLPHSDSLESLCRRRGVSGGPRQHKEKQPSSLPVSQR